jgi:DNA-binding CsgD family transcriptional regulator
MAEKFLGHTKAFWKKVAQYLAEGKTYSQIGKITGVHTDNWYKKKEAISQYLIQFTIHPHPGKPKGSTKLKIDSRTMRIIKLAAEAGRSQEQIAYHLDISRNTLHRYMKQNPDIKYLIEHAHEESILEVIGALKHRAKGIKYKETKLFAYEGIITDEREVEKYIPPSERAAELILVNKDNWKSGSKGEEQSGGQNSKGKILEWLEGAIEE